MGFIQDEDEQRKYKYRCAGLYINFGRESMQLPTERLKSMNINSDYINNLFPKISVSIALDDDTYYKIIENKQNVTMRVVLNKFYDTFDSTEHSMETVCFDKTLGIVLDDSDVDMYAQVKRDKALFNEKETTDPNDLHAVANEMQFFLYDKGTVSRFNSQINDVVTNTNLMDGMSYIINKLGMGNLLWYQFDNTNQFGDLLLPPLKGSNLLRYIDTYYGLYKQGSMIFCDWDRNYIMPITDKCTVWEPGEKKRTTIVVPNKAEVSISDTCSLNKGSDYNQNFVVADTSNFTINKESISGNMLTNKTVSYIDIYTGGTKSGTGNGETILAGIKKYDAVTTENAYMGSTHANQMSNKSAVINTILGDYDLNAFKPNKEFVFAFDDTKVAQNYGAKYMLGYLNHSFVRAESTFSLTTEATFYSSRSNEE